MMVFAEVRSVARGNIGILANRTSKLHLAVQRLLEARSGVVQLFELGTIHAELALALTRIGRQSESADQLRLARDIAQRLNVKSLTESSQNWDVSAEADKLLANKRKHYVQTLIISVKSFFHKIGLDKGSR